MFAMSALPPKADITAAQTNVRFVPKADILRCSKKCRYSITSSARASSVGGTSSLQSGAPRQRSSAQAGPATMSASARFRAD
jgi:hypothetical protein